MPSETQIRVCIPTPSGPYASEILWAELMGESQNEAIILNAPCFADDPALNYGDLVRVSQGDDGRYSVEEILTASGHQRLTVILLDPEVDAEALHQLLRERFPGPRLVMEALADGRDPGRMAIMGISIHPSVSWEEVGEVVAGWLDEQDADAEQCMLDGPFISQEGPFVPVSADHG